MLNNIGTIRNVGNAKLWLGLEEIQGSRMHAIDLAELATLVARYSPTMLAHRIVPPREAQQQFWLQSKYRHEFWSSRLAAHRQDIQRLGVTHRRQSWLRIVPIMEDILISEPLTRCIAHHARLLAEHSVDADFSTLANSTLSSHVEARHRCLHLLVFGEGLSVEHSVRLNRIRREMESFTDSILSCLDALDSADSICFDPFWTQQMRDGSRGLGSNCLVDTRLLHLESIRLALRPTLSGKLSTTLPCTPTNQRIMDAILGLLGPNCFDSLGVIKSAALATILHPSNESTLSGEFFSPPKTSSISQLIVSQRPSQKSSASEKPRWQ